MKGIIFDMDGTMVDNMMIHHRAWQRKLKELGLDWSIEEVHQKVHGVNVEILERIFGDKYSPEERIQISQEKEIEYRRIYKPELKLIDGLPAVLDQIRDLKIPLAIGSAAPPDNVNFVLDHLDLRHYFDPILHSDSVTHGKPHPEIYEKICDQLSLTPRDCLVFEDTPTGAKAAANAGCEMIIVTTTHQEAEFSAIPGVRKFIRNYTDLNFEIDVLKG